MPQLSEQGYITIQNTLQYKTWHKLQTDLAVSYEVKDGW